MTLRSITFTLALTAATLGAGCIGVSLQSQETRLVHDAATDTFELLVLSHGLAPIGAEAADSGFWGPQTDAQALERALNTVSAWAGGERRFAFLFAPLDIDIEQILESSEYDDSAQAMQVASLVADVEVLGAGAFLDDRDRLATWQRFRFPYAQDWVAFANDSLATSLVQSLDPARSDEEEAARMADEIDVAPRSMELMIERARSGGGWIALKDGSIVVDLPMTRADVTGLLQRGFESAADEEAENGASATAMFLISILRHLERVEIGDECTILEFAPSDRGAFVMRSGEEPAAYDPTLLEQWRADSRDLAVDLDLDRLRVALAR